MTATIGIGIDHRGTDNTTLLAWVREVIWVDGSDEEWQLLTTALVDAGTFVTLDERKRPNSFWAAADPDDVARVEERTFICSVTKDGAGPTNNWVPPAEMKATMGELYRGCMRGRTMYVVPFCMGPLDAASRMLAVEITGSEDVVASMKIMTRMGAAVTTLFDGREFVRCVHAVDAPLEPSADDVPWPCSQTEYNSHFPETREIWSYGSGYGGNALLGKKCYALRIASAIARAEGWDGPLYAVNPEFGFFGVAPGTNWKTNPNAMKTMAAGNSIFDYHVGDYVQHWVNVGKSADADKLPKIFYFNWFRRGANGRFLWPGFGENSRVLQWCIERMEGAADTQETALATSRRPSSSTWPGSTRRPSTSPRSWRSTSRSGRRRSRSSRNGSTRSARRCPHRCATNSRSSSCAWAYRSRGPARLIVHCFEEVRPMILHLQIAAGAIPPTGHVASYWCAKGHQTRRWWSTDVTAPELWECRCGFPAGRDRAHPPEPRTWRPFKSPLARLLERRSEAECEALLDEALQRLRVRRGRGHPAAHVEPRS